MASLMDKVGRLISANLHALVDSALKANSLAVLDDYIRQVEDNLDKLADATATVGGEVKTFKRKVESYEAEMDKFDRAIDQFLLAGKEAQATAAQSQYNSNLRMHDQYQEQYERQQAEYQKLLDTKLKLEAKLTSIKQEREELRALLDLAKTKELAAKTMSSLDDLVGADDADVTRIAESIRSRLDKAAARSEVLADSLEAQVDDVLEKSMLDSQLAERRKKLRLD